ncbi:MAG: acetate/propionate family kinase [Rickettsiales bacterium]|nr:acetate/propionate family kinase [Rickettsiales bacterium]
MSTGIIILNLGSTSLKFSLFEVKNSELLKVATGGFTGIPSSVTMVLKDAQGNVLQNPDFDVKQNITHELALSLLIKTLQSKFSSLNIDYAGHRIVFGGEKYTKAIRLDNDSLDYLESLSKIEPTHQYYEVMGARIVAKAFPKIKQSATFDTSFHRTMPEVVEFYPVPQSITAKGVRHWGFHGISYDYISRQVAKIIPDARRVIVAHLGGGASLCALLDGKSIDTTMQFGAITGPPMATRSGDFPVDAAFYLIKQCGYTAESLEAELEKHSGLLGASGGLSDNMHILEESTDVNAKKALAYFDYAVLKYIGSYTAILGGLDALVFTAGIGENDFNFRERICKKLKYCGIEIDEIENKKAVGITKKISTPKSSASVYVIPTNEELMIALNVVELFNLIKKE